MDHMYGINVIDNIDQWKIRVKVIDRSKQSMVFNNDWSYRPVSNQANLQANQAKTSRLTSKILNENILLV
ncbi:hypothetical protein RO3G_06500 [Rhizopus delemar RA 99-880]|uniref:Uncharacterized protein n=1 Tax=Rhizopus delemar (strain RA 99-880 / ATCC MYA-4621 / FGSC 9543 / NRRL 43880) TaxID=246409 RepID=I1C015_RHIO9|nr:hypothetical protein RO3G_06500 [Rhizopus delemar RA 99-880]|eukprot:EIE81795.1 hypothetical protein RO3G_06500 [Rhizopus delemar RA 99-880]